jgi:hypothetical protein
MPPRLARCLANTRSHQPFVLLKFVAGDPAGRGEDAGKRRGKLVLRERSDFPELDDQARQELEGERLRHAEALRHIHSVDRKFAAECERYVRRVDEIIVALANRRRSALLPPP